MNKVTAIICSWVIGVIGGEIVVSIFGVERSNFGLSFLFNIPLLLISIISIMSFFASLMLPENSKRLHFWNCFIGILVVDSIILINNLKLCYLIIIASFFQLFAGIIFVLLGSFIRKKITEKRNLENDKIISNHD